MNTERNKRFFKQQPFFVPLGLGMLIVGFLMLWLGWSAFSYYFGWALIAVGFALFVILGSRQVPESELKQCIQAAKAGLGDEIAARPDKLLKSPEPFMAEGFDYTERANCFTRGKDAKVLSDAYGATMLFFANDALLVCGRRICLTTGEVQDESLRLEWAELGGAELVPFEKSVKLTKGKNATAGVRGVMLRLYGAQGEEHYLAPIANDMDAEHLCETIARMIADRRA